MSCGFSLWKCASTTCSGVRGVVMVSSIGSTWRPLCGRWWRDGPDRSTARVPSPPRPGWSAREDRGQRFGERGLRVGDRVGGEVGDEVVGAHEDRACVGDAAYGGPGAVGVDVVAGTVVAVPAVADGHGD